MRQLQPTFSLISKEENEVESEQSDTTEPESSMLKKKNTLLESFIDPKNNSNKALKRSQSALTNNMSSLASLVRPEQVQPEGARVTFDNDAMK